MTTHNNDVILNCNLEALATPDDKIALSFNLQNPSNRPTKITYFEPFVDFILTVYANEEQLEIVQPAYDTGLQRISLTLAAGETARINTPIQLIFNPDVVPSGGNIPTLWTLRHVPTSIKLHVHVQLEGATVNPCETHFEPKAAS